MTMIAMTIAAISGKILRTLVTICTLPDTRAPVQATTVKSATNPTATSAGTAGEAKASGASELR